MVSLKGTQTEKNLLIAFAGESQARNRYTMYASAAKKEGFQAISKIFLETADQEKEHASRLFKFLEGGDIEITASFPAGKIGTTLENLQAAAYGEHEENTEMYPKFAQIAAQEGFPAIAEILKNIGLAERYHESRFRALAEAIEDGTISQSKEKYNFGKYSYIVNENPPQKV